MERSDRGADLTSALEYPVLVVELIVDLLIELIGVVWLRIGSGVVGDAEGG